ncbi:MAG TPA: hypothetical protein DCP37_17335 [Dehalococcoidia bacterium]|nr:SMP-30/gluconolactonase/LRE family protein [SAR202 cluster bacterium]MQG59155.1 SMP-30/gluconolactonase/LRE family protein [SAR202 cluster bacterium]HAL49514.1 hypothetical protein [Dehalococcoidia bacterium]
MTPGGDVSAFANLPPAPEGAFGTLGMDFNDAGELFVAMASFDPTTHGIWKVSADGTEAAVFASLDVTGLPNVLDFHSDGNLFASDTLGGAVWKIGADGTAETWIADPLLAGLNPPGPLGIPIDSNGVIFDADESNLYVAVTDFNRVVKIPVNADGSAGTAMVFAEDADMLGGPDGVAWDSDGNLYVALLGTDAISSISPSGEITVVHQGEPLQNPSDVKFGRGDDSDTLFIANFAFLRFNGLVPGDPTPGILTISTAPMAATPPATGDPIVSQLGMIGLALGLALVLGGGALVFVSRRQQAV